MHPRGVGLFTELGLAALRGRVIDRGDCLVVTTPDDPGYYFGNLLVLPAAPQAGELTTWLRRFADELHSQPGLRHVALRWDGTHDLGARDELALAELEVEVHAVMTAPTIAPQVSPFEIRQLAPDELDATARLAFSLGEHHHDGYRQFLQRRAAWGRELVVRGDGAFWGAFDRGVLVGSLGLIPLGRVARYQDVQTLSSHRRRGIAGALLAAAARGLRDAGIERFVIVAEPGGEAWRVYERVGFTAVERMVTAWRAPSALTSRSGS